ncbi:MAG: cadherin-like beta sandwich domain-containing protein [Dysgonamonadaceae bacterium]|jgi:hypothetical protein|nr:cadherin-like beta sandwich domain-containing protein [Dysgonamonadaceae bacterium]
MKRKKNFLVLFVWAASLLGLFAVQVTHAADAKGFYIPAELAVYETITGSADSINAQGKGMTALLSSKTFDENQTHYDLTSAYKSRLLLLCFNWKIADGTKNVDSTRASVKVYFNNAEVPKYSGTTSFASYFTDVYVIPFGAELDVVSGKVEVDLSFIGEDKKTYSATVTRGEVDNITALRGIWVTDSVNASKTDTIFSEKAGEDGKLVAEDNWNISFKKYSKVEGRAKADTLYFQKFDQKSTVHVIKNDKDTLNNPGPTHVDAEIYKVKIEAGNKYTIAVTARDSITKDFYYVTLLDDTVKSKPNTDTLNYMLKDLYLYEVKGQDTIRYNLTQEISRKVGFNHDTLKYKVTAPWDHDLAAGYEAWTDSFKMYNKEVLLLKYKKELSGEKFIDIRVTVPSDSGRLKGRKGGQDTTYTIKVFSNDNFLSDLHLTYDMEGKQPLALTSDFNENATEYRSVDVEWNTESVFVWATPRDAKAKVDSLKPLEDSDVHWKELVFTKESGAEQTFLIPVRAEDTTLTKTYKVIVRRKWDPNLKSVTLTAGSKQIRAFSGFFLEKEHTFDVKVPTDVDFEDIEATFAPKSTDYYRVTKTLKSVGDQYSYVIKVASVDRKEETRVDKTYTFNLFHKSNDARLSNLSVTPGGTLSPEFTPEHLEYSVLVPHAQDHIYFVAKTTDDMASADVGGKRNLEVGEQTFQIVVTAENGEKTETYTVTVTRESATGILQSGVSSVYVSGQSLHVSTSVAERVSVYSAGGQLLYTLDKLAGKASVSGLPKGILIVKGSSGWVEKAVVR